MHMHGVYGVSNKLVKVTSSYYLTFPCSTFL